jgi:hypothetical protein
MSWKLMEGEGAMERRIRVVGLCLIAVFALSAVVVASAQATVEIGQCVKIARTVGGSGEHKYKGRYKSKVCTKAEEATPEEEGLGGATNKYEWKPGAAGNGNFSGKSSGTKVVTIKTGELEVKCKKGSTATGAIRGGTGSGTVETRFNFKDCVQPNNENKPCSTHGKEKGEIETKELIGNLEEGPEPGKEPLISYVHKAKGTLGEPAEPWVEFECIEKLFTVNGTLSGKDTQAPNAMSKKGGIDFSFELGNQGLEAKFPSAFGGEEEEKELEMSFEESDKYEGSYELRQQ